MIEPTAVAFINHLLRGASWAREALLSHAGKTARFEVLPFTVSLTVLESGEVAAAAAGAVPLITLRLTPGLLLRLAARDDNAWREVEVAGDTDFAATINHLVRHLRWDVEEDLSHFFGDVAAHRMAESGRSVRRWGERTAQHMGRSLAGYWTEEDPLIASSQEVAEFNRAIDVLRDDVARLEKRLDNILNRQARQEEPD
ncbi:MAG: ubiquinone biosynthesis protein [Betaproteobacteria bacterium]|nr:ubiquinone biosynthesis protein [Betaproteobacteria bacterium]MDH3435813.1 ubiquinone biosynthesis protein [Betaproteobacteria bacterium]